MTTAKSKANGSLLHPPESHAPPRDAKSVDYSIFRIFSKIYLGILDRKLCQQLPRNRVNKRNPLLPPHIGFDKTTIASRNDRCLYLESCTRCRRYCVAGQQLNRCRGHISVATWAEDECRTILRQIECSIVLVTAVFVLCSIFNPRERAVQRLWPPESQWPYKGLGKWDFPLSTFAIGADELVAA